MNQAAAYLFSEEELQYRFHHYHPFNQHRLVVLTDLLRSLDALPKTAIHPPVHASLEELERVHTADYIRYVRDLSIPGAAAAYEEHTLDQSTLGKASLYGFQSEDTPPFALMHDAASLLVGGTLEALHLVMRGQYQHAFHPGGGLHHAMPNKAAGFCIYNDATVAIAAAKQIYQARVLYVDTDVHHGDGVQWTFYTDPDVFTLSIHETGKYLYPGTGFAYERGEGHGYGRCVNIPLEPYTEDESWLSCFREAIERVLLAFKPDLIISQHGCDAHTYDPLSHLHCSMDLYLEIPRILHQAAHQHCDGRWIALGGGGYEIWRVVPRAWSLVWLEMTDHPLTDLLRRDRTVRLPGEWLTKWSGMTPTELPPLWLDPTNSWDPIPRRQEISEKNRHYLELALQELPPLPIR